MKNRTLLMLFFGVWVANFVRGATMPVSDLIRWDGTIDGHTGFVGSLTLQGYHVILDRFRGPLVFPGPPQNTWSPLDEGVDDRVYAIAVSGTDVYVGGRFENVSGISEADRIARWDGGNWYAMGEGIDDGGSTVYAIAVSGNNVYVGGDFTDAGDNNNADRIARWDGNAWNAVGSSGINNGTVYAIAVDGSDIYIGGDFNDAGGNNNADNIVRRSATTWNALGTGVNNEVRAIAITGTSVYIGGNFTNAGGNSNGDRIVRWNTSNNTWNALGAGIGGGSVNAIAIADNGEVYIGGDFENVGSSNGDFIVRWNGSAYLPLGDGLDDEVFALAINGSDVYIGGSFNDAAGNANADNIILWNGTGWEALGAGLNNHAHVLALGPGALYAGGHFTNAGGNSDADNIAKWDGVVLPVELVRFTVALRQGQALLQWETATETNNDRFEIQHSADGRLFQTVGTVPGNGTTSIRQTYQFRFSNLLNGHNYFRLKQVDWDGQFDYSPIVSVVLAEKNILIFPNPTREKFTLQAPFEYSAEVYVFSPTGQRVASTPIPVGGTLEFDMTGWPSGMYIIEIHQDDQVVRERIQKL